MVEIRPYGSWRSPITTEFLVAQTTSLGDVALVCAPGSEPEIVWTEGRPSDGGRNAVVGRRGSEPARDLLAAPFNARSRVHEYGGGAFGSADGRVYVVNFRDQQIHRVESDGGSTALTAAPTCRFADLSYDRARRRFVSVIEDHRPGEREPRNVLGAVHLGGARAPVVLESGRDFYAAPRVSPDGRHLAWFSWNHPNMPWDGSALWVAAIRSDGILTDRVQVAGGLEEAIVQPAWSPDGVLHFVSDRTGWWNLHRWREGRVEALTDMEAEFGRPHWTFANPCYGFASADAIVCSFADGDGWHLARLDTRTRALTPYELPYTEIDQVHAAEGIAVFIGGSPLEPASLVQLDLETRTPTVLARSSATPVDPGYLSEPEAIEFPTGGGLIAHGLYYPPRNRDFVGPPKERPPLRVIGHGGPTAAASRALQLAIQFWTSRGIAVLDVNYGGSTGYGRRYRERLDGQWGVVDVADCVLGARYLVGRGDVDPRRLTIRGGSAGGFTTLRALAFDDTFRLGVCYYGVSDLEVLATDTHKFESRYLDRLVGPYPARRDLYRERSPVHHVERISSPAVFFQGLEDRVVPPNQTEGMVEALRRAGVPVAYLAFEGEQHGFRRADTIRRALEAELYCYGRILGFEPADSLAAVPIDNLPE